MPLMLGMWPASVASSVSGNLRTRSPGRKEPTFPLPPFLGWAGIILVLGFAQCVPHLPQLHICWLGAAQHVCQALWKMGRWDPACGFTQPLHPLGHTLPGSLGVSSGGAPHCSWAAPAAVHPGAWPQGPVGISLP